MVHCSVVLDIPAEYVSKPLYTGDLRLKHQELTKHSSWGLLNGFIVAFERWLLKLFMFDFDLFLNYTLRCPACRARATI